MSYRAVIVQPDGAVEAVFLTGYDDVRAALNGGLLELVPVGGYQFVLYVDEEGISKNLPCNRTATDVAARMLAKFNRGLLPGDYIKGTAVFVGQRLSEHPEEGYVDTDLPQEVIDEYFGGTNEPQKAE